MAIIAKEKERLEKVEKELDERERRYLEGEKRYWERKKEKEIFFFGKVGLNIFSLSPAFLSIGRPRRSRSDSRRRW